MRPNMVLPVLRSELTFRKNSQRFSSVFTTKDPLSLSKKGPESFSVSIAARVRTARHPAQESAFLSSSALPRHTTDARGSTVTSRAGQHSSLHSLAQQRRSKRGTTQQGTHRRGQRRHSPEPVRDSGRIGVPDRRSQQR